MALGPENQGIVADTGKPLQDRGENVVETPVVICLAPGTAAAMAQ